MDLLVFPSWAAARDDLTRACAAAAVTGFLSHVLYFIKGYRDMQAFHILVGHVLAYGGITAGVATQSGIGRAFVVSTAVFAAYLASLFTSIVTYRLFFHPLRRFPGPLAAKITRFYGPWTARNRQMHLEQMKLFKQYGNIVRIAPNELYIVSSDAIDKIHASKSKCRKKDAGVYNAMENQGDFNLDGMLTREDHRWRRQVWERAMTTKQLAVYENSTREVCHIWLDKLASADGQPIDTTLLANLLTFEHMGKVGFSHDFGVLQQGKENAMLEYLQVMFGIMGQMGELVWPLPIFKGLGVSGDADKFDQLAQEMADRRLNSGKNHTNDIIGHFIEDLQSNKPLAFFNHKILYLDSALILVAATDTIGVVLSYLLYHLASNPSYQDALHDQILPLFGLKIPGEFTAGDLSTLPLLDACINETMRLDNPIANNAARLTPPEGIQVDGTYIPGGVSVRVPGYVLHRSEAAFERPEDFIPERWTTKPELIKDPKAFFPFLAGPNNCVGKRLAMNVTRLVVAYTILNFRFRFAPGEDGTDIYAKAKNNLVIRAGPLKMVFTKRA